MIKFITDFANDQHCQDLIEYNLVMVSTIDVPAEPCPEVRLYAVETRQLPGVRKIGAGTASAHCRRAARSHRAPGRAAHQSAAHILHFAHGVPVRKMPTIVEELTGVPLTQGTITQDAMRQAAGIVGARYEEVTGSGAAATNGTYRRQLVARGRADGLSDGVRELIACKLL